MLIRTTTEHGLGEVHLRLLYHLLADTLRESRLEGVYDAAMEAIGTGLGVKSCSILLFDPDGVMRFKAWRGLTAAYRAATDGHSPWKQDGPLPLEPVLVRDVLADDSLAALKDVIVNEGIRALAFFPMTVGNRLLGKFMVYHPQPHDYSAEEIQFAGIVAGNVAVAIDRVTREAELQTSEERFSRVFRASPAGISIVSGGERRFLDANDAFLELLGYERDEVVGKTVEELGLWADPGEAEAMRKRIGGDGYTHHASATLKTKDGEILHTLGSAEVITIGGEACVLSVIIDVTDKKRMDEAAVYLDAIVKSSDDAIIGKDLNSTIRSWNKGAERIFGYTAEEAIGKSIRMIIPAERQGEEDTVLDSIRRGRAVEHFETERVRKDGTLIDISLTVSPIRDASGKIVGASKIARDVSDRKRADRVKDQFLSLISHELRTPLATMIGDAILLRDRFERISEDDRKDLLDDLLNEGGRLRRIIENLLLLTRLESAGLQLEPVLLKRVVDNVLVAFRARHPGILIELSCEPDVGLASANTTYVELVVGNFLSNAAKYTTGGSAIEICVESNPGPSVRVLDRGIGITDEDSAQLFTPFYGSERASAVAPGMGVGLAVCKRVIEAQGGTVWAKPRPGGGSEFGFSLRRVEEETVEG